MIALASEIIIGPVVLLLYDIPARGTSPNGGGIYPWRPSYVIKKYIKQEMLRRIQESVLEVLDAKAIYPTIEAVTAANGTVYLVKGYAWLYV